MRRVPLIAVLLFTCAAWPVSVRGQGSDPDAAFLRSKKIGTDAKSLLKFFRDRTPDKGERDSLQQLVDRLGSRSFRIRDKASKDILLRGEVALPYLKAALKDSPLEVVRRAKRLIEQIEAGTGPDIIVAAGRLLASHHPEGATECLLDYMPAVDREWVGDELLACLGELLHSEKQSPDVLLEAVRSDHSKRKAAAAYVLGRWGGVAQRDVIRPLLDSDDRLVKGLAGQSLTGKQSLKNYRDTDSGDDELLVKNNIKPAFDALCDWLEEHTLSESDQAEMRRLLFQLGNKLHRKRQEAMVALLQRGTSALPFLRQMTAHPDLEIARRCKLSIKRINEGPGPALPAAVIRDLTRNSIGNQQRIATAVEILVGYAPFAEDESVEDAVVDALCMLSVQQSAVHPDILAALDDSLAARRAVAAKVLGQVGVPEHVARIDRLLFDNNVHVRYRAVQGLLAAGEKQAVPALIDLLIDVPRNKRWQAEEMLHHITRNTFSPDPTKLKTIAERQKAWRNWWDDHGANLNVAGLGDRQAFRGLLLIAEYDTNGRVGGRVWEAGLDGKQRWSFSGVVGAMDAQLLPNGRVLVAENSGRRVTERDRSGKVHWEYSVSSNPVTAQRLPNGNTFIACYNQILEVTPGKQVVYTHRPNPSFYIYSAKKLRNGDVVCFTQRGQILELDAKTGRVKRTISIGPSSGWGSVDPLPNGHFLVANQRTGDVKEIDEKGKTRWQCQYAGAFRAVRLPNGHTAVVSMTRRNVVLFDSGGQLIRQISCQGRPWSVRFR